MKPEAGATFGPYRLIRLLGQGGFAQVWEADNVGTGRRLALKILTEVRAESTEALDRFQLEGRMAASISHPRCVYVFGTEHVEGYPAITMELMSGGTLAERIKDGPLPVVKAVDAVLDVVAGLEAAQQSGIIHRDIKPSNCFIDDAGGVKIGDFGISKSLGGEGKLTATGSFLGTPFYASPEQVGGEAVDYRSDIYSVGAMLYELLTGQVPYAGTNAGQIIAQVLTKDPTPFSQHAAEVPRGLQRVIFRAMAKDKTKRFQSHEALRAALFPFSSRGLSPAGLAKRFGAIAVDLVMFAPVGTMVGISMLSHGRSAQLLGTLSVLSLEALYFSLMEGLLGWTLGKRIFGLRVTTAAGASVTVARAALRALIFEGVYQMPSVVGNFVLMTDPNFAAKQWIQIALPLLLLACAGALLSTMRKRNGYAGLHEVLSGTRVAAVEREERVTVSARGATTYQPLQGAAPRYGPYQALGVLWRHGDEAVVVAHDDDLRRDVWIHVHARGASPLPVETLMLRRGAMPWLQRSTHEGATWDAYGAPQGIALARWVAERGRLAWKEMRGVLHSLAREIQTRFAREGTAGRLSLHHVWVDTADSVSILSVPVDAPVSGALSESHEVNTATWLGFTRRVATLGFGGDPAEGASSPPMVPLPDHARELLARVYSDPGLATPEDLVAALDGVRNRPPEVTQIRRFGPIALQALVPAIALFASVVMPILMSRGPAWITDLSSGLSAYARNLTLAEAKLAKSPGDTGARADARAIRIVLSGAYAEGHKPEYAQMETAILQQLPHTARATVDSSVKLYPNPSAEEVAAARQRLVPLTHPNVGMLVPAVLFGTFLGFGYVGFCAVVLAFILGNGAMLQMFGMRVQRKDGRKAERWRAGVRSLIAWAPVIALAVFRSKVPFVVQEALIAVTLIGIGWSLVRPSRGPVDLIMGTVLMPK